MPIRPKEVSPPLHIYRIKINRAALDRAAPEVRRNLLLFGHIANEINTLCRLLILSMNKQDNEFLGMVNEARATTLARFLIGTTREGFVALENHILGVPFGRNYLPHLRPEDHEHFTRVKRHLSDMKLLAALRNQWAFHFPDAEQIDRAYARIPAEDDMLVLTGAPRHSTCYVMSSLMATGGMLAAFGADRSLTDAEVMHQIMNEVLAKSTDLNAFIEGLLYTIISRENLSPQSPERVLTVDTHESLKSFSIPPLLRS